MSSEQQGKRTAATGQGVEALLSVKEAARLFELKESRLRYWAQTGFINPSGQQGGRRVYTFADLIEIKAARELLDAGISLHRVRRNLEALRQALPDEAQPLNRLRVQSDGETLVVVEAQATFEPLSGQTKLDFGIDALGREVAQVLQLPRTKQSQQPRNRITKAGPVVGNDNNDVPSTAYGWFLRGCALEEQDKPPELCLEAYRQALALDPTLAAAQTNLGNLYYGQQRLAEARQCYEQACTVDPGQAEARYNLANLYEEDDQLELAIAAYRRAINCAPEFADAHHNLALVLERVGGRQQAMSHWRRYLELVEHDASYPDATGHELARQRLTSLEAQQT